MVWDPTYNQSLLFCRFFLQIQLHWRAWDELQEHVVLYQFWVVLESSLLLCIIHIDLFSHPHLTAPQPCNGIMLSTRNLLEWSLGSNLRKDQIYLSNKNIVCTLPTSQIKLSNLLVYKAFTNLPLIRCNMLGYRVIQINHLRNKMAKEMKFNYFKNLVGYITNVML